MTPPNAIRPAAVAGLFYPHDAAALSAMLARLLAGRTPRPPAPKAIIAPHAGYLYSGTVAARAYRRLAPVSHAIRRVVLVGPAHRMALRGMALPTTEAFRTPLGCVPLDRDAMAQVDQLPDVAYCEPAHQFEHSLEVHLPFLQTLLERFTLVPLVVGLAEPKTVTRVLETLWGGPETLIVISSDLSHYHPYESARALDEATARDIETLGTPLHDRQACGSRPVNGLLPLARSHGLKIVRLDLRNSGDTAGRRDRVVGYGAWALYGV